jgi:cytochrome P450
MSAVAGVALLDGLDLTDPKTHAGRDRRAMWREIRRASPVLWHPVADGGFWVVSRHRHTKAVYADAATFSSGRGNSLDSLLAGGDPAGGRMLSLSDGDRHVAVRAAIMNCLRPSIMSRLGALIEGVVRARMDEVLDQDCDLVQAFAKHIPLDTISALMGIAEAERRAALHALSSTALSWADQDTTPEQCAIARSEILLLFEEVVAERRRAPGDDLVSDLTRLMDADVGLSVEEILYNCYSLFLGGNEEPRFALAGALHALAEHPDQWEKLKAADVAIRPAVEELLRWTTPVLHLARTATAETTIGDTRVRTGDIVSVWNISANFDEEVFGDADRLMLDRADNPHLSFGFGKHFCLGASLARMQLAALLTALVEWASAIEMTAPSRPVYSNFITGFAVLPGRIRRRGARAGGHHQFADVEVSFCGPEETGLLCLLPSRPGLDARGWLQAHAQPLQEILDWRGGIVLRDFGIASITEFNRLALTIAPVLQDYVNRSTPRTRLGGKIYTATEYPAERHIPLHNENSYADAWPTKIIFFCAVPAVSGGETTFADSRRVYAGIDPAARARFQDRGVLYVRNFTPGVDLSWQDVFQTDDPADVDTFCRDHGIITEWRTSGPVLTTRQTRQATLRHPRTGELAWFNQAHLFHLSALTVAEQAMLTAELGPGNVPRNAFYGDGEPLEPEVLAHIRAVYDRESQAFAWHRGDVMVLDNVLMAHGRNPFTGPRKLAVAME